VIAAAVPPLFAPDESGHALYVRSVATQWDFPVLSGNRVWAQETGADEFIQPPVFYVAAAGVYRLFGDSPRGLYAIRGLNAVLGTATVAVAYLLALTAARWRRDVALMAAAFAGLLPMAAANSASVSNDALTTLLSTALLLVVVKGTVRRSASARDCIMAAALLALLLNTKPSGVILAPTMLAWATLLKLHARRRWWCPLGAMLAGFGAALPWWVLRNRPAYGDLLGINVNWPSAPGALHLRVIRTTITWIRSAFVIYGGHNEISPKSVYLIPITAMVAVGLVALAWRVWRGALSRRQVEDLAPLLTVCAGATAALYSYGVAYDQGQGRYFMPALAALSVLVCMGLADLVPGHSRKVAVLVVAGLALFSVVTTAVYLPKTRAAAVHRLTYLGLGQALMQTGDYQSWVSNRTVPLRWEDLPAAQRDAAVRHEMVEAREADRTANQRWPWQCWSITSIGARCR